MKKLFFLLLLPFCFTACEKDKGNLDIVFRMLYDGEPITMFQRVAYPNGGTIFFDRVNVFVSDISAQQADGKLQNAENVAFLDFSTMQDMARAMEGIVVNVGEFPVGKYDELQMGIGLDDTWNKTTPADYDTNHPLSNNYWEAWNGYIFMVLEGKADIDDDGQTDFSFSYHIGKDEAYDLWTATTDFDIAENEATQLVVTFDVKKVLSSETSAIDMEQYQVDHSAEAAVYDFLRGNFVRAFNIK